MIRNLLARRTSMGKEREKLFPHRGRAPLAGETPSEGVLARQTTDSQATRGSLPPEIAVTPKLLVGYGTLLSRESVADTVGDAGQRKTFLPVVVPGFRRLFNLRPVHYAPSLIRSQEPTEVAAMNVLPAEGAQFNGLAFPVSEADLVALDDRERYYERIRVPIISFPDGRPLGQAWTYSASREAPAVFPSSEGLLPHWRDVVMAREGAYSIGKDFGRMFDQTTFMADGCTLVVDEYSGLLPELPSRKDDPGPVEDGAVRPVDSTTPEGG